MTGIVLFFLLSCSAWQGQGDVSGMVRDLGVDDLRIEPEQREKLLQFLVFKNYAGAEVVLNDLTRRDPMSPEIMITLGRVLVLEGKAAQAVVTLRKADGIRPLAAPDRLDLGLACFLAGETAQARGEFEKLIAADGKRAEYHYWLGRVNLKDRKPAEGVANLRKALELDPDFLNAYDALGTHMEASGALEEALKIYEEAARRARQRAPSSPKPALNLGRILQQLGRFKEAEASFRESLLHDPGSAPSHYFLGLAIEKQGRFVEAIEEERRAVYYNPRFADPYYALTRLYRRQGDMKNAEQASKAFEALRNSAEKQGGVPNP